MEKSSETWKGSEAGEIASTVDGFVDYRGDPASKTKHGGIRATIFVFVMAALENMANLGTSVNLVTYFHFFMYYDLSESADILTNCMGTTFLLSLIGAFISDAYLTRSKTLLIFGAIEAMGFILLTIQARTKSLQPTFCNMFNRDPTATCPHVSSRKSAFLFSGLYLIALGSGGVKATLASLGADQFNENDPKERRLISSFFNFFLFSLCVGSSLGVTFLVWLQNNKGWDVGLGISSAAILLGLLVIALGYTRYRNKVPTGSPLSKIFQVLAAAFRNQNLDLPDNDHCMYEILDKIKGEQNASHGLEEKLPHTCQFRFLDRATIIPKSTANAEFVEASPWKLCTVTHVEEVKILIRMVPVFASTVLMNTCLAQLQTFSVQQGSTLDTHLGRFKIPPASLPIIPMLFVVILTPIYDRVSAPFVRSITGIKTGITHLQRVGVGLVLYSLSMAVAAAVEIKRKDVAVDNGLLDAILVLQPLPMSVFWLSFQYFIFVIADLFTFVGLLEFFYSQAPAGFRSLGTAFSWCLMAFGYFLSSILVKIINAATRNSTASKGWLEGNNINRNHLDLFYWTLAILSVINFFNYLYWANWYKYKPVGTGVVVDADDDEASS